MKIPEEFARYHRRLLGSDYGGLVNYVTSRQTRHSIRVNTLKSDIRQVRRALAEHKIQYGPIAWCGEGLWVDTPELDYMEHQLGLYYIQNASSMIAPHVLGAGERVLDLCAAPGGKTTHLAQLMDNRGLLVANEDNPSRIRGLVYNIQRCGVSNAVVTMFDACRFSQQGERFDRILLDAPCSSVGTVRNNREVLMKWTLGWVKRLAEIQKRMILEAYDSLTEGGVLVYSTCTTTIEENEQVIENLLRERPNAGLEKVVLGGIKLRRGLTEKTLGCARIYPQDNDSDPHFIAKVIKGG